MDDKANKVHSHTAAEVHARPDTWMPSAAEVGAAPANHSHDGYAPASHTHATSQITGLNSVATTGYVTAGQKSGTTLGDKATAEGYDTIASNIYSHAEGWGSVASGQVSHAEGRGTTASGEHSHAEGSGTTASAWYSHSEGLGTVASGNSSHAGGYQTEAKGSHSFTSGRGTVADDGQCAIGYYNKNTNGVSFGNETFSLGNYVVIGNGKYNAKSNAFRFTADGKLYCLQAYSATGADYAEMFEWMDGNPEDEDRRGLFVTLIDDKIQISNGGDNYILGIISGNPSVIGDNHADQWAGQYLRDVFGTPILEDKYSDPYTDDNGVEHPAEYLGKGQVQNPDWDPDETYTTREHRKEWDAVGMMGKLVVIDDGTCVPNGYCWPTVGGIATAAETGYRVMKRIDGNHIFVLFR